METTNKLFYSGTKFFTENEEDYRITVRISLDDKSDKIKREHVRELKRIFQILLNHKTLEVLGTVNVIVDEVCGEGTYLKYRERVEKYRINIETKQEKSEGQGKKN